jgi:hypothetical protein
MTEGTFAMINAPDPSHFGALRMQMDKIVARSGCFQADVTYLARDGSLPLG